MHLLTILFWSVAAAQNISCGISSTDYNITFHIGAIFIVLVSSGTGSFVVLLLDKCLKKDIVNQILQLFRMFGIGVVAATAWIHLLPDAFAQFSNPCLQGSWSSYGTNYVGLFGLIATFLVQLIETGSHHSHDTHGVQDHQESQLSHPTTHAHEHAYQIFLILLEAGILFHSLVIGVNLGISPDATFVPLLIAICFHQMFEGMALASLVSASSFSLKKKILMSLMYLVTTPIGMAIGVGLHSRLSPNDPNAIAVQGILDSLSAGILMYNTYCELMSVEINHSAEFAKLPRMRQIYCFVSMYCGAAALAIIGIWA